MENHGIIYPWRSLWIRNLESSWMSLRILMTVPMGLIKIFLTLLPLKLRDDSIPKFYILYWFQRAWCFLSAVLKRHLLRLWAPRACANGSCLFWQQLPIVSQINIDYHTHARTTYLLSVECSLPFPHTIQAVLIDHLKTSKFRVSCSLYDHS